MAGSTATIEWVSKDEALVRTLQKTERGMEAIARKMDKVEASSRQAARATISGFEAANTKVAGFVSAFIGVGAVMAAAQQAAQVLKAEWQELKARQQASLDKNVALADVLPSVYRQAGGLLSAKEIEAAVEKGSKDTGLGQVKVGQAIGEALAARGATNKQEAQGAIDAAVAALKFAPEADAQTAAALSGGTTDLQRRFNIGPEAAIGYLARVGGQARVTSLREQVQNINPAIGSLSQFGMNPQSAGALVSVMTGATGDFTGAMSRTASIQLAKQLTDRGFANPDVGIAALQADPELREAFFKGGKFGGKKFAPASFEAASYASMRELLTGGSALAQNFAAATREVGTFEQGEKTFNQMVGEIGELTPVKLAAGQRKSGTNIENFLLGRTLDARTAAARNILGQSLDAVNFQGPDMPVRLGRKINFEMAAMRGAQDPEVVASMLLRDTAGSNRGFLGPGQAAEQEFLRQQANKLDQIYLEMKKQNETTRPTPVEIVNPQGVPAPPATAGFGR